MHLERIALCFATAIQYEFNVIVVVINGMRGSIRAHWKSNQPKQHMGAALYSPNFAALARSYGANVETGKRTRKVAQALKRFLTSGKPALVELQVSP